LVNQLASTLAPLIRDIFGLADDHIGSGVKHLTYDDLRGNPPPRSRNPTASSRPRPVASRSPSATAPTPASSRSTSSGRPGSSPTSSRSQPRDRQRSQVKLSPSPMRRSSGAWRRSCCGDRSPRKRRLRHSGETCLRACNRDSGRHAHGRLSRPRALRGSTR
jgi:hypothetical protein